VTLLIDFLCRFGCGLAVALCLTSTALVPGGFFRVNLLVVLGLATFAGLLAGTAGLTTVAALLAGMAVVSWIGSVLMFADRRRGGLLCCAVAAGLGGIATVLAGDPSPLASVGRLASGCLIGLTVNAMLLGHWYLNAPGMRVDALRRSIDQTLMAWGLLLACTLAAAGWQAVAVAGTGGDWFARVARGLAASDRLDQTGMALLSLRWLAGLLGLPVLLVMSRKTLEIPNTQSATGILYVACLAVILGELTAQLLATPVAVSGEAAPLPTLHPRLP